jgi:hypothetical protein
MASAHSGPRSGKPVFKVRVPVFRPDRQVYGNRSIVRGMGFNTRYPNPSGLKDVGYGL